MFCVLNNELLSMHFLNILENAGNKYIVTWDGIATLIVNP